MSKPMIRFPVRTQHLSDLARHAGRWWLKELLSLFPVAVADWLSGRAGRSLVLATDGSFVTMHLQTDGRRTLGSAHVTPADYGPTSIDRFLRSHGLDRARVAMGIRLPGERFFCRSLILPVETLASLDKVVVQDIVRRTPFELSDIYHGFCVERQLRWRACCLS
jgi:general secretion pathway protein L